MKVIAKLKVLFLIFGILFILFFIIGCEFFINYKIIFRREREAK